MQYARKEDEVVNNNRRAILGAALAAPVLSWAPVALSQTGTGSNPIRIVVPYPRRSA